MTLTRICLLIVASFALSLATAPLAAADSIANELEEKRSAYEAAIARIRTKVEEELARQLNAAEKSATPLESIRSAKTVASSFRERGELPVFSSREQLLQQYAVVSDEMLKGYASAITAYSKQGKSALADAVDAEARLFQSLWDLVPWQTVGDDRSSSTLVRIVKDAKPSVFEIGRLENYRVEIKGKRTSESGSLIVGFPLARGRSVEQTVLLSDKGTFWTLATISGEALSADLGLTRPIDMSKAAASEQRGLTFRALSSDFQVDSIRFKPIVKQAPPTPQRKDREARKNDQNKGSNPAVDPSIATPKTQKQGKEVWRGTWTQLKPTPEKPQAVTLKSVERTAERLILRTDLPGAGGVEMTFTMRSGQFALTAISPTGDRGGVYHDAGGSARVSETGNATKISAAVRWQVDTNGRKKSNNIPHEVQFEATLD